VYLGQVPFDAPALAAGLDGLTCFTTAYVWCRR